jgi:hypothetical protein
MVQRLLLILWFGGDVQNILFHLNHFFVMIGNKNSQQDSYCNNKQQNKRSALNKFQKKRVFFHSQTRIKVKSQFIKKVKKLSSFLKVFLPKRHKTLKQYREQVNQSYEISNKVILNYYQLILMIFLTGILNPSTLIFNGAGFLSAISRGLLKSMF